MAANGVRRSLKFSSASAKSLFKISPAASKASSFTGFSHKYPSANRFSRVPVELGAAISLMPMHSVTASALFTSLLSLHNTTWGCLSEGFATTL